MVKVDRGNEMEWLLTNMMVATVKIMSVLP